MPDYIAELDSWFTDVEAIESAQNLIASDCSYLIEFDEGSVQIPIDCQYEVTSKALIKYYEGIAFGPCFRIVIAVGGLVKPIDGCPEAKLCFVTLWYTAEKRLITNDYTMNSPD